MTHIDPWRRPDPAREPLELARERAVSLCRLLEAQSGNPVRLVETHISWLLIGKARVYKLKKPIRLTFLDYTTLAGRRRCCEEEIRLNRRLAPSLYLGVAEICDSPAGPVIGGAGPVVDVAVLMRRFPDGALWSEMLAEGALAASHVDAMARTLDDFHRVAAVAPEGSAFGSPAQQRQTTLDLIRGIEAWQARTPSAAAMAAWPALRDWLIAQLALLAPVCESRQRGGHVRECHGDLHLANVLQLGNESTAFDGIEFDDALRWIDVLDDIAFLAMDLMAHGRRGLALRFLNACLEANGDYDGLPVLRFYLVRRALVRALVAALAEGQGGQAAAGCATETYLALASALALGADARLAITHGLPGSGKSFVSQQMIEQAGAFRVRSDVERKRLFAGATALSGLYDEAKTARTYARLLEVARIALAAGWPAIVDAAFLRHEERASFADLAATLGVPFAIIDCRAPLSVLHQRIERRLAEAADPSDADGAVLERLRAADVPLDDAERGVALVVDAEDPQPVSMLAQRWLAGS